MSPTPVYSDLTFPDAWGDRPWVSLNMVATLDGKILSGERTETVMDLGSATDHATMRAIESAQDAVMIGAGSLRATAGLWYPQRLGRYVVSASGNVDTGSRFFTDAPERAYLVTEPSGAERTPSSVLRIVTGPPIDLGAVLATMRAEHLVRHLLVEGGSELNAGLFALDLIDEIFLTVAPKIKLGRDVPTIAGGDPLDRSELRSFALLSVTTVGDEVFLRYRRSR